MKLDATKVVAAVIASCMGLSVLSSIARADDSPRAIANEILRTIESDPVEALKMFDEKRDDKDMQNRVRREYEKKSTKKTEEVTAAQKDVDTKQADVDAAASVDALKKAIVELGKTTDTKVEEISKVRSEASDALQAGFKALKTEASEKEVSEQAKAVSEIAHDMISKKDTTFKTWLDSHEVWIYKKKQVTVPGPEDSQDGGGTHVEFVDETDEHGRKIKDKVDEKKLAEVLTKELSDSKLALDTKEDLALARLVASKTKAAGISNVEGVVSKVNEFDAKLEKVASTESEIESIRTRKESLTAAAGDPKKLEALQEKLEDELSDAQDVLSRKESEMKRISDRKRALDKLATLHERTETDVDTRVNKILSSIPGLKQYAEKSDKKEDDKEREDHSFRALTECELDNSRAGLKRLSDNAELVGQALNAVQSNQMRQDAEMEAIRAGNEAADAASTTCSAITDPKAAEAKLAEVAGQKKALEDQLTALKTQVGGAQQACMQESQQSKDKKAVPQSCAVANNASQGINVLRAQLRGPAAAFKSCSDRKDMLMLMAVGSAVNAENQQKMDLAKAYQAGAELLTKAAADAIAKANSTPAAAAAPTSLSPTPIINGGLGSSTGGYPSIRTRQGGNAGLGPRRSSPNGGSGSVRSRSASSLVAR